jgi:hypothetical protein
MAGRPNSVDCVGLNAALLPSLKNDVIMKNVIALAFAVSLLAAAPVNAQTIDFATIKCKDVAALPKATLELIAVWLDGFQADDDDPESMKVDLTAVKAHGDKIKAHCRQHPTIGLLQAAEETDQ